MEYKISDNGCIVGKAEVNESGLYCTVRCTCQRSDKIQRIIAKCGEREENIGICVPSGKHMEVKARIPKKRLQNLQGFCVASGAQKVKWLPLKEGQPVDCLYEVLSGRLAVRNGQIGVEISFSPP